MMETKLIKKVRSLIESQASVNFSHAIHFAGLTGDAIIIQETDEKDKITINEINLDGYKFVTLRRRDKISLERNHYSYDKEVLHLYNVERKVMFDIPLLELSTGDEISLEKYEPKSITELQSNQQIHPDLKTSIKYLLKVFMKTNYKTSQAHTLQLLHTDSLEELDRQIKAILDNHKTEPNLSHHAYLYLRTIRALLYNIYDYGKVRK